MAKTWRVRKRCGKCGRVAMVGAYEQHCLERPWGLLGYTCVGPLEAVVRPPRPKVEKRPQDLAAAKLAQARKNVSEATKRMARLATSLRMWERRAAYYAKRASLTDAEIATEKAKGETARVARAEARKRRGIQLSGLDKEA